MSLFALWLMYVFFPPFGTSSSIGRFVLCLYEGAVGVFLHATKLFCIQGTHNSHTQHAYLYDDFFLAKSGFVTSLPRVTGKPLPLPLLLGVSLRVPMWDRAMSHRTGRWPIYLSKLGFAVVLGLRRT